VTFPNPRSLSFDGTNDHVILSNSSSYNFDRTDPFTIAAWVKSISASPSSPMAVLGKINVTGTVKGYVFWVRGDIAGDPYELELQGDSGMSKEIRVRIPRPSDIGWHHVVWTYDGSGLASGVRGYVDGVLQTRTTITDNLDRTMLTSRQLQFGARDGTNNPFAGSLDDARIYDRVLTGQEVASLAAGCSGE
jgi:hypothetical protein